MDLQRAAILCYRLRLGLKSFSGGDRQPLRATVSSGFAQPERTTEMAAENAL
jgi:hypothetical protein